MRGTLDGLQGIYVHVIPGVLPGLVGAGGFYTLVQTLLAGVASAAAPQIALRLAPLPGVSFLDPQGQAMQNPLEMDPILPLLHQHLIYLHLLLGIFQAIRQSLRLVSLTIFN